jgi:uncharacterized membrane protein
MTHSINASVRQLLQTEEWHALSSAEREVIADALRKVQVSRDTNREFNQTRTMGERLSDRIAEIGGSWGFIISFGVVLFLWALINERLLGPRRAFDPYPFIFLNLMLSMLAAIQAPIIMMSQKRSAQKDRLDANADYQVNLKAELEVRRVQEKLDVMRDVQWVELIEIQSRQLALLETIATRLDPRGTPDA